MSKKPSLAEALSPLDRTAPEPAIQTTAPAAVAEAPRQKTSGKLPPSRAGKKPIISYHDPAVSKQLHQMKLDLDRKSVEDLITEALNDLFAKYKRPTIA